MANPAGGSNDEGRRSAVLRTGIAIAAIRLLAIPPCAACGLGSRQCALRQRLHAQQGVQVVVLAGTGIYRPVPWLALAMVAGRHRHRLDRAGVLALRL